MSNEWGKDFLTELGKIFSGSGIDAYMTEFGGGDALMIEPDGEEIRANAIVTVEQSDDDCTCVSLMLPLFDKLEPGVAADLVKLVRYMNKYLTLGSFAVSEEDGTFIFSHTFVIDEDTERVILCGIVSEALDIAEETAAMGGDMVLPVIKGEKPVSELLNNESVIVQQ
ncbi:MAG: hypothetical protein IK093_07805 [Ruminiclostridium sp.]|nr:hypothetical protein [Ruminiclostridium sp.]